jgi:hypothetical protein
MLWNGNECGKNEGNGKLKQLSPMQILINQKPLENVEYFKYFVSKVTNAVNMFTCNQTHNGEGNSSTQQEEF